MRFLTFLPPGDSAPALGLRVPSGSADWVLSLSHAVHAGALGLLASGQDEQSLLRALAPAAAGDLALFLQAGETAMLAARLLERNARLLLEDGESVAREAQGLPCLFPAAQIRYLPAVHRPGKVLCIGLNFPSHIEEARRAGQNFPPITEPLGFGKTRNALAGHQDAVLFPVHGTKLDYEVELAFVIGKHCRDVKAQDFSAHVAGYSTLIDFSLRDLLFASGGNPFLGKNFDGFSPLGPSVMTLDEAGDTSDWHLSLSVNGVMRQHEALGNALFDCADILAYWSARYSLEPGDVITTGTPAGVGIFSSDPERDLLRTGDEVVAQIGSLEPLAVTITEPGAVSRSLF